ncbi:MAG: hypothetical protein R6W99_08950, partial [Clostridia bacterium]
MIYFVVYLAIFAVGTAVFRNIDIKNRILGIGKTFAYRPGKKTIAAICAAAYIPGFLIFRIITEGILPAAALGMLPAIGAYAVIDVIARVKEEKEAVLFSNLMQPGIMRSIWFPLRPESKSNSHTIPLVMRTPSFPRMAKA